jgi:hypothetical protein
MRPVSAWGALALVLHIAPTAFAQAARDVRHVSADQVEVRSGPSDSNAFYVTNRLQQGQQVEVVAEMPGGWLAIKPPEGSFSYINTRFLRHMVAEMPTYVVTLNGVKVPVYIGSEVVNKRPTQEGAKLEAGAQVVSCGKPLADEDGTWMPIEAPVQERRFVKASAVAKTAAEAASVVRASASGVGQAPANSKGLAPSTAPSANVHEPPEAMWQKAEQAERAGNVAEAVRLYALVGAGTAQTQAALSSMALERARYLQGGYQSYGATAGGVPPPPSPVQVGAPNTPGASRAAAVARPANRETISYTGQTPRLDPSRNGKTTWESYRGILRRAGRTIEGQTTYVIDDPGTLYPIVYAAPARGVNLEAHLNRIVTVSGYTGYRGELRNKYMIAVRLEAER